MKKLKAAVVGVGYLGHFHAQKYKNNPLCDLVAVSDVNADQGTKVAKELGVAFFNNPKELLGKVDLVTVACSTQFHYEVAKLFVGEGIPVNVEKPMTATLQQAESLVELSQSKKSLLTVGHIERFSPSVNELKNKMAGSIRNLELTRWAPFKIRGSDVSVVFDLMIHDLDLMFWLMSGQTVSKWSASGSVLVSKTWDQVNAQFEFKDISNRTNLVSVSVNRSSGRPLRQIRADSLKQSILANTGTHELEMWEYSPNASSESEKIKVSNWTLPKADSLQLETNHFVDCVLGNSKPLVTAQDGLNAMIWADKIEKSLV